MVTIEVKTNIKEVERKLRRAAKKFPKQFDAAIKNAGNEVAAEIKKITPIVSSSLRKSIRSRKKSDLVFIIKSRNRDGLGTRPEKYVNSIEYGPRGKPKPKTKNRNRRARRNARGAYQMFGKNVKKARRILKKHIIKMLRRIKRMI